MMMNPTVVEIKKLFFSYNDVPVLEDVDLSIPARGSLCMVGPNGGGKSTLLKLMLGLLHPDSGTVKLLGDKPEHTRARVGYVPQYTHFDPQFPVTVLDVVLMGRLGRKLGGRYTSEDKDAAGEALAEMRLAEIASKSFAALSGGQRQRVLIARALVSSKEFLILDEPTANIDPRVEADLFDILASLDEKMTILLVTHDLGFVSQFFKSVICVNRRVVTHPTREITGELIKDIYGGNVCMIRHDHSCGSQESGLCRN